MIYFCIAQTWLYKLEFVYKKIRKDVFIDSHKWPDMVKDWNCFLTKIKELKLYIIEFNENSVMKAKDYLVNYTIEMEKRRAIIVITYNKYTFFANDGIQKA